VTTEQHEAPLSAVEHEEHAHGAGAFVGFAILTALMLLMAIKPMHARPTTVVCREVRQ